MEFLPVKKTKQNFKLTLDVWYPINDGRLFRNGRYQQRKRGYGSYLYSQDKDKFNILYEVWNPKEDRLTFETESTERINNLGNNNHE